MGAGLFKMMVIRGINVAYQNEIFYTKKEK